MKLDQRLLTVALLCAISVFTSGQDEPKTLPTGQGRAAARSTAAAKPDAQAEITVLLREFLSKVDSAEVHDRFWADDLIYTGATGAVKSKADTMKSMREGQTPANR